MKSSPSPLALISQLAPDIDRLDVDFVQQLMDGRERATIADLVEMLSVCPVNDRTLELIAMRGKTAFGDYFHSDPTLYNTNSGKVTIQDWVRGNFESMIGSLTDAVGKMLKQSVALGHSSAEIVFTREMQGYAKQVRLKKLNLLDPTHYSFAGFKGEVDRIIYSPTYSQPFAIPIQKILYTYIPKVDDPDNPNGSAAAARAYPFYRARQVLFKAWTIAGQKQATGTTVVQAPSDETVNILDASGQPIKNLDGTLKRQSAVHAIVQAAKAIENGGVLGTDINNKVMPIPGNAGENFFQVALSHYQKMVFMCYGIPSTIMDDTASGIGNSGVNAGHRLILDSQIEGLITGLRDQILEKVVRPLLVANFGAAVQDNLGYFETGKFVDPQFAATRVSSLTAAMSMGLIDTNDLEAVNRLREDLAIKPITREEFDQIQLAKLMQQQEQPYQE